MKYHIVIFYDHSQTDPDNPVNLYGQHTWVIV